VEVRRCLSEIINVSLDDMQWTQATLPVRDGGLGIRRCSQVTPSIFLASATTCSDLILTVLPQHLSAVADLLVDQARGVVLGRRSVVLITQSLGLQFLSKPGIAR
jgi:hypothetical protein